MGRVVWIYQTSSELVADLCDDSNETSGYMKGRVFIH